MDALYPLRFQPLLRRYLWGGRRLASHLHKQLGPGDDYAESWEVVDHGADQSRVAFGPLAGTTLGELVSTRRGDLLGSAPAGGGFPLLFKFLDCHKTLSVQVHPSDAQAAKLPQPDLGKTEAWVILHAEPGAVVYAGFKRGFDRPAIEREMARGTVELCLHKFEPQLGDCIFVPAGTVHALGAGLVVAEIQQASDTTFRLFDWNRVGADGLPRPLHVREALEVIDYAAGPVEPVSPLPTSRLGCERLVACDKFVLNRWHLARRETLGGDGRFRLVAVLAGEVHISGDAAPQPAGLGDVVLLPAALAAVELRPLSTATLLEIALP